MYIVKRRYNHYVDIGMKFAVILLLVLISKGGNSIGLEVTLALPSCRPAFSYVHRASLFRSLARKIEAVLITNAIPVKTADDSYMPKSMAHDLLNNYANFDGDIFITKGGEYHTIKGALGSEKLFPFISNDGVKPLAQHQHGDGHVFSLRQDGLYYSTYSADQARILDEGYKFPLRLLDDPDYYYQDLLDDMGMLIAVEHDSGNSRTISKATERLLQGEDLHLLKLLQVRDEVALYKNDTLLDVFESIYYESFKRKGIKKGITTLEEIDIRIAELGLRRSSGNRQYLNFNSQYTWDRTEIAHYLRGEKRKLGADSIARLRIMANNNPKLQRALDEILRRTDIPNNKLYRMSQTEFEQALTEVSSVFHMLDINSSFPTRMPTKEQQVNKFLKEVAKRKNKVLHQYFDTVVLKWDRFSRIVRTGTDRHYLDRILFMEDLILAKKQNTSGRWTVREALEDLGIGVDEYISYTSNSNIEDKLPFDILSSIVMSINTNFEASAAQKFTAMFLDLHQDVAIVKDVKGAIEVVGVE